ncbi:hypothetical protein HETIRDRAFT_451507 [Heterobasidion irregulare TC 32-1]|uniref:Uncharacterized protein n=1 Tax=Heterobasidion irregulare (strain TC 32-1) TaxID=747525 RepID=W4K9S2_HETIT|nr:uncharacterized protein HETIRDRAFT_451507 [Heterobasidion irregulare TC 32-1]ETW81801.1 hypothetical protein HETIRDRAFT_451507 [Heterobasidion irregulare TC 32-1]
MAPSSLERCLSPSVHLLRPRTSHSFPHSHVLSPPLHLPSFQTTLSVHAPSPLPESSSAAVPHRFRAPRPTLPKLAPVIILITSINTTPSPSSVPAI